MNRGDLEDPLLIAQTDAELSQLTLIWQPFQEAPHLRTATKTVKSSRQLM